MKIGDIVIFDKCGKGMPEYGYKAKITSLAGGRLVVEFIDEPPKMNGHVPVYDIEWLENVSLVATGKPNIDYCPTCHQKIK